MPLLGWNAGDIDRHDHIGASIQLIERQRIGCGAINEHPLIDHHRAHHRGQRDRGGECRLERTRGEHRLPSPVEIGGDDGERNAQCLELFGNVFRQELLTELFRVEQRRAAEPEVEKIRKGAGAAGNQAPEYVGTIMGERDHEAFPAAWNAGASFDWRQKVVAFGDEESELTAFTSYRFNRAWKFSGYLLTGFTNASPDFGVGAIARYTF